MPKQTKIKKDDKPKTSEALIEEKALRFQNLNVDSVYIVKGKSDPIKGKFGTSYILTIQDQNSKSLINIWSTKLMATYIKKEKPNKSWKFTVKLNKDGMKYPEIKNYSLNTIKMYESESESEIDE